MLPKKIPRELSDEELILETIKDKEFFGYLIKRYQSKIIRYIKNFSNVPLEVAQDIAQETFIKAYINLNNFDQNLKFSSWLYRIAHNQAVNYWRKHKKEFNNISLEINGGIKRILKTDSDLEKVLAGKIEIEKIKQIILKLPPKYRSVVILRYFEEKSYEEISDIIKKPPGTVGTFIFRAKKILKKELINNNIVFKNYETAKFKR